MPELQKIKIVITKAGNKKRALGTARFFKTGIGQYGEGDIFIGLTVPISRVIAKQFKHLPIKNIGSLLRSKIHEERLIALLILVEQFRNASISEKKLIFNFYLSHTKYINNWDLVDLSADKIVGEYLVNKPPTLLIKLAHSKNIWERRISIIATFAFIKRGDYKITFRIVELLLTDNHDLIHKASGWMLREVGKRISFTILRTFLDQHAARMPRTMLRYSIEHFPEAERKKYLLKKSHYIHSNPLN
jgi:3-methyladenine DNA glycosylase AlkD